MKTILLGLLMTGNVLAADAIFKCENYDIITGTSIGTPITSLRVNEAQSKATLVMSEEEESFSGKFSLLLDDEPNKSTPRFTKWKVVGRSYVKHTFAIKGQVATYNLETSMHDGAPITQSFFCSKVK